MSTAKWSVVLSALAGLALGGSASAQSFQYPSFSPAPLVTGTPWRTVNLGALATPASGTYRSVEVWVDWVGEPFTGQPNDNQWSREANLILSSAMGTGGSGPTPPTGLGTQYAPLFAPANGLPGPQTVLGMRFAVNLTTPYTGGPLFLTFNQDFDSFLGANLNNARWADVRVKLSTGFVIAPVPASVTNLGTLPAATTVRTGAVGLGPDNVRWFKFTITGDVRAGSPPATLDIDTEGTGGLDTKIYLFRGGIGPDNGNLVAFDDDDGTDKRSQLSFGATGVTANGRPYGVPTGFVGANVYNGRDGALTAGEYYLAVASFSPNAPANGYVVTPGITEGTFQVNLRSSVGPQPTTCLVDFNRDNVLNQEDLGLFISAFLAEPPAAGPGGFANGPCPGTPAPYDTLGYKADFNRDCGFNQEDLIGFITEFFAESETPNGCVPG